MQPYKKYPAMVFDHADKVQIIEIEIPKEGSEVTFDADSLTSIKEIIGVAMINPNPKSSGHGTLRLRIGDEEILPAGFHADMISKFSSSYIDTKLVFGFKHYVFPMKVKAEGKPVRISYTEPGDGGTGILHLYLLGVKESSELDIPCFRFQLIEITVPKGDYADDTEIQISEKTLQSHKKVVGAVFLGPTGRVKEVSLSIDDTSVFPSGMVSPLVFKEISGSHSIAGGIFAKHTIPLPYMLHACDIKAKNSKIECKITAVGIPDEDYKVFLYLLTISE